MNDSLLVKFNNNLILLPYPTFSLDRKPLEHVPLYSRLYPNNSTVKNIFFSSVLSKYIYEI